MRKIVFLLIFIQVVSFLFSFPNGNFDFSKGPLYGKNMYLPFLIYYNFPSISAKSGREYEFNYHLSTYYIQDFYTGFLNHFPYRYNTADYKKDFQGNGTYYIGKRYYDSRDIIRDYESCVTELGFSFYIQKKLQVGIDFRLYAYYTGGLDKYIEGFHHAFGFPGGAREYFEQNKTFVNIQNYNGIRFYLDKPTVSFGDIDLWVKYTFFERKYISLAGFGAFKIPTGTLSNLSGSGYPDMAFGVLADFRPLWILSFYFQSGIVIPFDSFIPVSSKPYPMFNGLVGVELNPVSFFSLLVQFNIKTSSISGDKKWSWNETFGVDYSLYDLPQVNTLVGFKFKYKEFNWQFYFEEDSFTNQGADISFNLTYSQSIRFLK